MTSPTTSGSASIVPNSGVKNIDALLSGDQWGLALGGRSGTTYVSYSFPWINGLSAVFSGPNGGPYNTDPKKDESLASQHFGLNAVQQQAAKNALIAWSNVANISFQYLTETSTNVGDIRFAFSSQVGAKAWGHASYPSSYWPTAGDVWINPEYPTDIDWGAGSSYNFQALLHEIGHALGLKHPFEDAVQLDKSWDNRVYTIMSYTDPINELYPNAGYVNGKWDWITYLSFLKLQWFWILPQFNIFMAQTLATKQVMTHTHLIRTSLSLKPFGTLAAKIRFPYQISAFPAK